MERVAPKDKAAVVLYAAHLLATKGWTQHFGARDSRGRMVSNRDPTAVCYCLTSAVSVATSFIMFDNRMDPEGVQSAVDVARVILDSMPVPDGVQTLTRWNDRTYRTKEEVIEYLTRQGERFVKEAQQ